MKSLIKFSVKQDVLINVIFIGLITFSAIFAVPRIPIDRYPNLSFGEVQITTRYPGASPEEVERLVTNKIEKSLRGMEDIAFIRSTSIAYQSMIFIKFEDDTDYDELYNELRFRVLGIQNQLPVVDSDLLVPRFTKLEVDEWLPVLQINLIAADPDIKLSTRALTLIAKDLRNRLEQLPDLKEVIILGAVDQQYIVSVDPKKLEQHRITITEVIDSIRTSGKMIPAGKIDTIAGERLIRIDSRFRTRDGLLGTIIRREGNGNMLRLRNLINEEESGIYPVDNSVISTVNGRDTVSINVLKKPTANAIKIFEEVDAITTEFVESRKHENFKVIYTLDSTVRIGNGIGVLSNNLMLSIVLVMLLLFLFMTHQGRKMTIVGLILAIAACLIIGIVEEYFIKWITISIVTLFVFITCRTAVLTVSGIVFSFLGSLTIFYFMGQSINELSLLGFVLVCGIVVDDAIVIIENIQRLREEGKTLLTSVVDGTAEVFWPVVSASMTTIAAFLPLFIMTGTVGDFFSLIPTAVLVALSISLVECLFILPLHVIDLERLLGVDRSYTVISTKNSDPLKRPGLIGRMSRFYDRVLKWTLSHPKKTLAGSFLMFVLAVFILIAPFIGFKPILKMVFFPDDTSIITVKIRMPEGSTLERTDKIVRDISKTLMEKGTGYVSNTTGSSGMSFDINYNPVFGNQHGYIFVELPSRQMRKFEEPKVFIHEVRGELESKFEHNGVDIEITAAQDGPPVGQPINVRITGLDESVVSPLSDAVLDFIDQESKKGGKLDGIIDIAHSRMNQSTVISFMPDRKNVLIHDLRDTDVQQFVADSLEGAYVGEFRRIDDDIPIRMRLSRSAVVDPLDLIHIPIVNSQDGRIVRFSDVGFLDVKKEPSSLTKRDFERANIITGNLREDSKVSATSATRVIHKWYKENLHKFPGATLAFGGESESTGKSYHSLAMAFFIAIILIYGILAAQFHSYLQPFLIMSNIIFSFTGVILLMSIFGIAAQLCPEGTVRDERSYFTVQSFIAIIGLTGLVVNDAIVLINFINNRIREGIPLSEALLTAGHQRMRPIIMTTSTTIAGLMPMAIGIPDFSITWSPFATCFIAGLTFSTAMTLTVLPVLFQICENVREKFAIKKLTSIP